MTDLQNAQRIEILEQFEQISDIIPELMPLEVLLINRGNFGAAESVNALLSQLIDESRFLCDELKQIGRS